MCCLFTMSWRFYTCISKLYIHTLNWHCLWQVLNWNHASNIGWLIANIFCKLSILQCLMIFFPLLRHTLITRICKSVFCIRFELYCVPIYTVRVNRFSAIYLLSQIKRCKMSQLHMLMTVNHTEGLSFSVVTSIFLYDIMQSQRYHFFVLLIVLVIKIMKCYSS